MISDSISTNTGAPQGSPIYYFLFSVYTIDWDYCIISEDSEGPICSFWKYADDFTLLARLRGDGIGEDRYRETINRLRKWNEGNNLTINVTKTKDLVVDFQRKIMTLNPIRINNQEIEIVSSQKFLGTYIQNTCKWDENTS